MPFVKTWSSSIIPRNFKGINSWYYHKIRTTHIPALFRAYLQTWNMVFDFLFFWFCIQQKITKSRNFSPACKEHTFKSLRMLYAHEKKKKGKGRNRPFVSRPISFPLRSILFRFQVTKLSPYLLSWRVLKILRNVPIL